MKQQRASMSKRARFRIFERDSFTCQYCGKQPPEAVLQLDHIHPFSLGGEDTEENLVTACFECNAGKSDRVLGAVQPRPDSNFKYLQVQQEISEARLFLEAQAELEVLNEQLVEYVKKSFETYIGRGYRPQRATILDWLSTFSVEEIDYAIRVAGRKSGTLDGGDGALRYISAIMAKRAREDGGR